MTEIIAKLLLIFTVESRSNPSHSPLAVFFSGGKDSKVVVKFGDKSVLPPITESVFPEVRSCMEEKDFHINIIKGKKKVTGQ